MSLPLYLLRRSRLNIPSALCTPDNKNVLFHIPKPLSDNQDGSSKDGFRTVGNEAGLTTDAPLTYTKLLKVLLEAEKVITL
jgi:hypothetical protein